MFMVSFIYFILKFPTFIFRTQPFSFFYEPSPFVLEQIDFLPADPHRIPHAQAATLQRGGQAHIRHPVDAVLFAVGPGQGQRLCFAVLVVFGRHFHESLAHIDTASLNTTCRYSFTGGGFQNIDRSSTSPAGHQTAECSIPDRRRPGGNAR